MTQLRALSSLSTPHDLADGGSRTDAAARRNARDAAPVAATGVDAVGNAAPAATAADDALAGASDSYVVEYIEGDDADRLLAALGLDRLDGGDDTDLTWTPGYLRQARLAGGAGPDTTHFQSCQAGLFESTVSPVAAPELVVEFDAAEGDRIETLVTDGVTTWGNEPVLWRGTAAARFDARLGQSVALAGEPGDPAAIHVWTFYDATLDRTVLFVDRNRDFVVGGYDLRLEFVGKVTLSPDAFSAGTFFAVVGAEGEDSGTLVFPFDRDASLTALEGVGDIFHARRDWIAVAPSRTGTEEAVDAAAEPGRGVSAFSPAFPGPRWQVRCFGARPRDISRLRKG